MAPRSIEPGQRSPCPVTTRPWLLLAEEPPGTTPLVAPPVALPSRPPRPPKARTLRSVGWANEGSRFRVLFGIEPTRPTGAIRLDPPLASIVPGCVYPSN